MPVVVRLAASLAAAVAAHVLSVGVHVVLTHKAVPIDVCALACAQRLYVPSHRDRVCGTHACMVLF